MATFSIHDGQFRLNGEPTLIQAGEFHYYRTPADQWAHRLGLLKEAGFNTVASYIPWLWHQPAPDVSDVDGRTHPMRNLAGFLDLAANMGLWVIARPGPYIMAETINEGVPPWVFEQNPQTSFVDQNGAVQNIASTLHPDFLRAVEGWYDAVFEVLTPRQVTHGGPTLLIQLDNEMGMIQWVRNILDTNPDTVARFAAWLDQHASGRYPTRDLAAFVDAQLRQPDAEHGARLLEDYRRFYRDYLAEYVQTLWQMAAVRGMDVPPVLNIHGFTNNRGGRTFPIGLSQLVKAMELPGMISATDVYPIHVDEGNLDQLLLINEMTKAVQNPDQPLFSIEFQAGGNQDFSGAQSSLFDLHTRLVLSVGMRGINHYLFFDGENDPVLSPTKRHDWGHPVRKDGTLRGHYARYGRLSKTLTAYGTALVTAQPKPVTAIGFVLDDFMTEVHNASCKPADDVITHQREVVLFDFMARGLALTHRPFEAVELARATLDAAQTPTLWVMTNHRCDAAVQQKLADYVRQGGRLLLAGRLPAETHDDEPCAILRDALGITATQADPPFTPAQIQAFDYRDVPVSFVERYSGDLGEVFAADAHGTAVGFVKPLGRGQVMVLGAALAANTLDDLGIFERMAIRMGCTPQFTLSEWADVRLSEGEQGDFLFVANYQDDPVETVISNSGGPLFGGHPVRLQARRGAILPLDWSVRPGVLVHFLNAEVVAVVDDGATLTIHTDPAEAVAELTLTGYRPASAHTAAQDEDSRWTVHVNGGSLTLVRD